MNTDKRKIAFTSLVGSHNYGLNDEFSDKDYKVFVIPLFEDLYKGDRYSKNITGENSDFDIHDIRDMEKLLYKSNVNFIEILFSDEINIGDEIEPESKILINTLFSMKMEIARMNIPYLYQSSIGMFFNKMKYITKGTENTMNLVEKYGYDTKQALQAYRILDFLERFEKTSFFDFKSSIFYASDTERDYLKSIKKGCLTFDEFTSIIEAKKINIEQSIKPIYMAEHIKEKTNTQVNEILRNIIRIQTDAEFKRG